MSCTSSVEIEAVLNSRPLTPLDSSPDDGTDVLTQGHFLIGRALKSIPVMNHSNRTLLTGIFVNALLRNFGMWSKEYVTHLQVFTKCHYPKRSVAVNDIVLLKDTDLFIRTWPLGRVIEVHPGKGWPSLCC